MKSLRTYIGLDFGLIYPTTEHFGTLGEQLPSSHVVKDLKGILRHITRRLLLTDLFSDLITVCVKR